MNILASNECIKLGIKLLLILFLSNLLVGKKIVIGLFWFNYFLLLVFFLLKS